MSAERRSSPEEIVRTLYVSDLEDKDLRELASYIRANRININQVMLQEKGRISAGYEKFIIDFGDGQIAFRPNEGNIIVYGTPEIFLKKLREIDPHI
ncbi:MAG: hypothetical protein HY918_03985 [Candidatus Doudnabacteria bacterium]|nr:hypothetical protein [Candidatus Doudnabacteria bacterium]